MKILAIDSSAVSGSAAVVMNGKILAESFINVKLTHSQTLITIVEAMLKNSKISIEEIDLFAVCTGPGSFTGIRIGVSAVKGFSFALNKPCIGVSTLEALKQNLMGLSGEYFISAVMDARCSQVYNANFLVSPNGCKRLCDDRAIIINELLSELKEIKIPVFLVGDGADLCYNSIGKTQDNVFLSPPILKYLRASSVASVALEKYDAEDKNSFNDLNPTYLRLPQAERELLKKQNKE